MQLAVTSLQTEAGGYARWQIEGKIKGWHLAMVFALLHLEDITMVSICLVIWTAWACGCPRFQIFQKRILFLSCKVHDIKEQFRCRHLFTEQGWTVYYFWYIIASLIFRMVCQREIYFGKSLLKI